MLSRIVLLLMSSAVFAAAAAAQFVPGLSESEESRQALADAIAERNAAQERARTLEKEAERADDAAAKAAREAAALAASIQEAEAGIAAAGLRMAMIDAERDTLRAQIGERRQPIVRLTAALQQFSRRPVALSLLQPGSVKDVVFMRAVLHDTIPTVQQRTTALRAQLARAQELRREARVAASVLQAEEQALGERRARLAQIEERERSAARAAGESADREAVRALSLAEEMRDLDSLVGELDRAVQLGRQLAQLAGPSKRPARPGRALLADAFAEPVGTAPTDRAAPSPYLMPVAGPVVAGFGSPVAGGLSQGLSFAPIANAQVVSPAPGRVSFAGPYRGFGQIVIVTHDGGWTTLITGLAQTDVAVGDELVGGAPLGNAGASDPQITLELRRDGNPVNPLSIAR